jgi:site-specific recombinase XerD
MAEIDTSTVNAFIAWLNEQPFAKGSRHKAWSSLKQLIAWLQSHRPNLMDRHLELPFNPFPRKNDEARPREAFSHNEFAAVLAAAHADINASWRTFQEGREAFTR